jgi:hypothetical protein
LSEATDEKPRKKSRATSRAEAGLVEEDAELQVQDEAIAAGEHIDFEAVEEEGAAIAHAQSTTNVSGMSEEEQFMEMTPVVVGPPGYGSPDPITSAGRLLPLEQHPFNPENLPEDHPAAIDEQYGEGYDSNLAPDEVGTHHPGAPQRTDLEKDTTGDGGGAKVEGEQVESYDEKTKDELLAEAQGRGLEVNTSNTKAEIVQALEDDDAA